MISILSYAYNAYQADFSGKSQRKQDLRGTAPSPQPGDPSGTQSAFTSHHHLHQASGASQPGDVKSPLDLSSAPNLDEVV